MAASLPQPESFTGATAGRIAVDTPLGNVARPTLQEQAGKVVSQSAPPRLPVEVFPQPFRELAQVARQQHQRLYEMPVIEYADGSRAFGDAQLIRRHGLNILFLKGDHFEMAFQHGRLLFDQIPFGAPLQSAQLIRNQVKSSLGVRGSMADMLASGIHWLTTDRMLAYSLKAMQINQCGEDALHDAIAMADATGMKVRDLIRALFTPETLMLLAHQCNRTHGHRVRLLDQVNAPVSCCSSFAAWGAHTSTGEMVIGRNMDYPMNGSYDRFPTVIYYEPKARGQQFMTCVSAGVQNAGLNAYNEAGLFISCHTVASKNVSWRGIPVFMTANQVIRRAHNLDTAVEMFRSQRPPTGWSYLVASTREQRVATLEFDNQRVAVRESKGTSHVQTNHYVTDEMQDSHVFLNTSVCEDNDSRYVRIAQRLDDAHGKIDAQEAASILADQVDPLVDQVRGVGNTVGVHTTMTSLVVDVGSQSVYVSSAPGPACHGDFVKLPLVGASDRDAIKQSPLEIIDNRKFEREHPEKWRALQFFIRAKTLYEKKADYQGALEQLRLVVQEDPSNPAYFFQLGMFAAKNKLFDEAIEAFDSALKCVYVTTQIERLVWYYRGRTYAHLGRKEQAIEDLTRVVGDESVDRKLHRSAQRALTRVLRFGRYRLAVGKLALMMQQSDLLEY